MTQKMRNWGIFLCIAGKSPLISPETNSILLLTGQSPLILLLLDTSVPYLFLSSSIFLRALYSTSQAAFFTVLPLSVKLICL